MLTAFTLGSLLLASLLLPASQVPAAEAPASAALPELAAPIDRVTLSSSTALVRRRARVASSGTFRLPALPASVDESELVLRLRGGQVGALRLGQPRDLRTDLLPLEAERAELARRVRLLEQRRETLGQLRRGVILRLEAIGQGGGADTLRCEEVLAWTSGRLAAYDLELNGIVDELAPLEERLTAIDKRFVQPRALQRELEIDVVLSGQEPALLELEYPRKGASWRPVYDLRVRGFDSEPTLELLIRAEIEQTTGEDWSGVSLELSTAEPERGASRPPLPRWSARVHEPVQDPYTYGDAVLQAQAPPPPGSEAASAARALEVWQVPGRSDLVSGGRRTVPIDSASLPIAIEHFAAPAQGAGVWRVGRLRYQGQKTLLPGSASVYLEGDFVGKAELPRRFSGEELELPLGLDPRLSIARTALLDKSQAPGLFGSRRRLDQRWRIELAAGPGRPVTVFVEEALPISNDSRIAVELERGQLQPSPDERFRAQREERGLLVFPLRVEPGSRASFDWGYSVSFPDRLQLELAPGP